MPSSWQKRRFVERLHEGAIVAYPTESVFGLGCDPENAKAVWQLLRLKSRPWQKGLILIASDFYQLESYVKNLPESIVKKIHDGSHEPTTWLLPAKDSVPKWLTGEHKTIAVRLVQHDLAKELCSLANMAIVSTSANITGQAAIKTAHKIRLKFSADDVYTINALVGKAAYPSRIIDPILNKQFR
ncbi:MAG: tRNA threonylcarbamoyladenosine biosynthesis protein RimN [Cycloclasticus sp. symbiont of Poecilosclerida sp. M]|nr:MAG: tRNA threonylcarbamoyladenosine biosynthesis protein RimN [Cycloclasticus sp. symbiont of Poecilosclerida sp. M]